jgi:hypothetical protein
MFKLLCEILRKNRKKYILNGNNIRDLKEIYLGGA